MYGDGQAGDAIFIDSANLTTLATFGFRVNISFYTNMTSVFAHQWVRKKLLSEAIAEELSLTQIKLLISTIQQPQEGERQSAEEKPLKERVDDTFKRLKKSKVMDDPKKQARIEKLLVQLNALMN